MSKFKSIFAISLLASLLLLMATASYANVEMNSFTANWQGNKVSLNWQTGSESDIEGFYVWRSETNLPIDASGQIDTNQPGVTPLTAEADPIVNPDGSCGGPLVSQDYEHSDDVTGATVTTYYFYLQARKCSGDRTGFFGDGNNLGLKVDQMTPSGSTIYLPIMLKN